MGGEGRKNCNGGADERAELVCQSQIGLLVVVAQQEQPGRNSKEGRKEGRKEPAGREGERERVTNCSVLESAKCQPTDAHSGSNRTNAFCRFFIASAALTHARTVLSFFFSRPIGGKMAAAAAAVINERKKK